jgi:hypothetical protein
MFLHIFYFSAYDCIFPHILQVSLPSEWCVIQKAPRLGCAQPAVIGADGRTPIPIPRRIDPCAGRRAPRRPGWRRAPGSGTAAAGRRPDGCPWTGGARREEEAQPEAAEEAATATALRTRTVRFRLEQ